MATISPENFKCQQFPHTTVHTYKSVSFFDYQVLIWKNSFLKKKKKKSFFPYDRENVKLALSIKILLINRQIT